MPIFLISIFLISIFLISIVEISHIRPTSSVNRDEEYLGHHDTSAAWTERMSHAHAGAPHHFSLFGNDGYCHFCPGETGSMSGIGASRPSRLSAGMSASWGDDYFAGTTAAAGFGNWPACAAFAASASAARRFGPPSAAVGWMRPADMMSFAAASTGMSSSTTALRAT
jgi:hypothetical protein